MLAPFSALIVQAESNQTGIKVHAISVQLDNSIQWRVEFVSFVQTVLRKIKWEKIIVSVVSQVSICSPIEPAADNV